MTSGFRLIASAIFSCNVFPVTVIVLPSIRPPSSNSFNTAYTPPATSRSSMYVGPAGAK
ncbi:hypothetical protein EVA_20673 [gut metagenome]|uniref:Uncharacterized protein n=1 Tax=gut metagenome TaxID=749906 RepID=J9BUH3_9ZZZZ